MHDGEEQHYTDQKHIQKWAQERVVKTNYGIREGNFSSSLYKKNFQYIPNAT